MSTTTSPPTTLAPTSFPAGRRRPRMTGRVVLITGGTRGIGADISRSFAEQGAIVAAGYGRDADRARALLEELSDHGVVPSPVNFTPPWNSPTGLSSTSAAKISASSTGS